MEKNRKVKMPGKKGRMLNDKGVVHKNIAKANVF